MNRTTSDLAHHDPSHISGTKGVVSSNLLGDTGRGNPRPQGRPRPDSFEAARSGAAGPHWQLLAWLAFQIAGIELAAAALARWWKWKTLCAWCKPPRRLRGNPFARNVTHTMCPACQEQFKAQLHRQTTFTQ